MAPRKRIIIGMPRKNAKKKQANQITKSNALFYKMATDPTAPRLRGCTLVQTEYPDILQGNARATIHFQTAIHNGRHLYCFYVETDFSTLSATLYLGRLCTFTHTWQSALSFSMKFNERGRFFVLPLPWEAATANSKHLLFQPNKCTLLTLNPTMSNIMETRETIEQPIDLLSMIAPPDEIVINVELKICTNWLLAAADSEQRAVYTLLEVAVNADSLQDLALFRLDWATRQWSRVALVETNEQPLVRGDFMAVYGGYLYIGIATQGCNRNVHNPYWSYSTYSLEEVQRINLKTKVLDRQRVSTLPSRALLKRQSNLQFAQVGDTVYALNAIMGIIATPGGVTGRSVEPVRNQLWALHLPTMVLTQINNGPVGVPPPPILNFDPSFEGGTISLPPLPLMRHFSLVAATDGSELWALPLDRLERRHSTLSAVRLYRISLGASVPSLVSLTLDSLLLRQPLKALLAPGHSHCTAASLAECECLLVDKQWRNLAYLRSFLRHHAHLAPVMAGHLPAIGPNEHYNDEDPYLE